jgi:ribosomal protein L28
MARECLICKKKRKLITRRVKLRGKYNPTVKRKQFPNLQWVKVPLNVKKEKFRQFAGKRILVCTKCIKTLQKSK